MGNQCPKCGSTNFNNTPADTEVEILNQDDFDQYVKRGGGFAKSQYTCWDCGNVFHYMDLKKQSIKKQAEDVQAADMVDIPEGDITPDDIMEGDAGGDFAGGGDMGGAGDGMDFADDLEGGPGGAPAPQDPTDWNKVKIFPTGNLDDIIENQEDFEIDFSRLV